MQHLLPTIAILLSLIIVALFLALNKAKNLVKHWREDSIQIAQQSNKLETELGELEDKIDLRDEYIDNLKKLIEDIKQSMIPLEKKFYSSDVIYSEGLTKIAGQQGNLAEIKATRLAGVPIHVVSLYNPKTCQVFKNEEEFIDFIEEQLTTYELRANP
jgi:septal ring factor EnvC (AmiA/AmiB activator)